MSIVVTNRSQYIVRHTSLSMTISRISIYASHFVAICKLGCTKLLLLPPSLLLPPPSSPSCFLPPPSSLMFPTSSSSPPSSLLLPSCLPPASFPPPLLPHVQIISMCLSAWIRLKHLHQARKASRLQDVDIQVSLGIISVPVTKFVIPAIGAGHSCRLSSHSCDCGSSQHFCMV